MVATGYLGFLGNGFGYALGAAIANPGALVVNIQVGHLKCTGESALTNSD